MSDKPGSAAKAGAASNAAGDAPAPIWPRVAAAFLIALAAGALLIQRSEHARVLERQRVASGIAADHGHVLQVQIERGLSATYALAALVRQGNGSVPDFEAIAEKMLGLYGSVSSLQLAPSGVISKIVPLKGNEAALGHDLLADPSRNREAIAAMRTHKLTLAGPFSLLQGGVAVIGRLPVYVPDPEAVDRFWGFTTALMRIEDLADAAKLTELRDGRYRFALWRIHPDSGERHVFAGSSDLLSADPVNYPIEVPNGRWVLSIAPEGGWHSVPTLVFETLAALFVASLVGFLALVLLRQPQLLRQEVSARTRELAESNRRLQAEMRINEASAQQLRKLSQAVEQSPASVMITDTDGYIEYVNNRFCALTGYSAEECIGRNPSLLRSGHTPEEVYEDLWETLAAGGDWRGELLNRKKNGETFWESLVISPMRSAKGEVTHYIAVKEDVTARKRAAEELGRLNRTLKVLSACNFALVHAGSEQQLLDGICGHLVRLGGYPLAWVGLASAPDARRVSVAACAGRQADYVRVWSDEEHGRGLSGQAIRTAKPVLVRSIETDPRYGSWRAEAKERGFASSISLPLKGLGGALRIYAADEDAFSEAEVDLLRELADDLAYGVTALRGAAARREAEEALHLRERALESSSNAVLINAADPEGNPVVYVNPAFERLTGCPRHEALGREPAELLGDRSEQHGLLELRQAMRERREAGFELRGRRRDGREYFSEVSVSPVRGSDGAVTHFVSVFADVSERKRYEDELARQANQDALTGLPNRNLLHDRLQHSTALAQRDGRIAAVLLIDLDNFKVINDSLGHGAGDEVLKHCADVLRRCVRESDTVARLGGDEFAVVLTELVRPEDAVPIASKILEGLSRPVQMTGHEGYVTASIGVSLFPRDGETVEALLMNADSAMYRAKEEGRNTFRFFTPEMNVRAQTRLELEIGLRGALGRGELMLHYQPKVELRSGRITGAEALIRWQRPGYGMVSPAEFIPLAEETGLILPIGAWVLRMACEQAQAWARELGKPLGVAVNLSARQFRQGQLTETVRRVLADTAIDPACLELELTETMMMQDPEAAAATLREIKALGVKLSMDDFGTGYSSLAYLKRFPIDWLKIDRSFVRDLTVDADDAAIAGAIIALARSLGLEVVAEGVETAEQLEALRALDCDAMQGFYFSRPLPPGEFVALVRREAEARRYGAIALAKSS